MPTLRDSGDIRITENIVLDAGSLFEKLVSSIKMGFTNPSTEGGQFRRPLQLLGNRMASGAVPRFLLPILEAVAPDAGFVPNNCLAHYYPTGKSTMGFHYDSTDGLDANSGIAVVSLAPSGPLLSAKPTTKP
ncbi:MAG: hypothetical protein U0792_02945 [Gemmataceae bacterium]